MRATVWFCSGNLRRLVVALQCLTMDRGYKSLHLISAIHWDPCSYYVFVYPVKEEKPGCFDDGSGLELWFGCCIICTAASWVASQVWNLVGYPLSQTVPCRP
jgi:hypothetical protein